MEVNEHGRFVDELLDASLKQFRSECPRPGLEGRLLAGVRAGQQSARRRSWSWALAGGAAITAIAAIVISLPHRRPAPQVSVPNVAAHGTQPPVSVAVAPPGTAVRPRPSKHRRTAATAQGQSKQFPTPRPLSETEKLLLIYARDASSKGLVPSPTPPLEQDLEVPELNIAAMEIKELPDLGPEAVK